MKKVEMLSQMKPLVPRADNTDPAPKEGSFQGPNTTPADGASVMKVQDVSRNRRISRVTQLAHDLEQSRTPDQTFEMLQRASFDVDGFVATLLLSTAGLPPGHFCVVRAQLTDESLASAGEVGAGPDVVRAGGIMAAIIARREAQLIHDVDWTMDPHFGKTLSGYSSVMAIPLPSRLPISWAILLKKPPERFTESDLEETVERAALVGALLENQLLAGELGRAHEQIDSDARRVGELQRALLPASLPQIAGIEIAMSYEPAGRAGGDLYDFFPLSEAQDDPVGDAIAAPSRWCTFIGDAAGHGLAAAVVMAIVQAVLHAHPAGIDGPASLLRHANRQLCHKRIGGFFTAFLAIYEPSSRRLTYTNAGHPPPLLRRSSDGSIGILDGVNSYPLGIDDSEAFREATVQLERGDTVLLYTDGITESRSPTNDWFERERLTKIMREAGGGPVDLIQRLRAAVQAHQNGQPAADDQTLVAALVL